MAVCTAGAPSPTAGSTAPLDALSGVGDGKACLAAIETFRASWAVSKGTIVGSQEQAQRLCDSSECREFPGLRGGGRDRTSGRRGSVSFSREFARCWIRIDMSILESNGTYETCCAWRRDAHGGETMPSFWPLRRVIARLDLRLKVDRRVVVSQALFFQGEPGRC